MFSSHPLTTKCVNLVNILDLLLLLILFVIDHFVQYRTGSGPVHHFPAISREMPTKPAICDQQRGEKRQEKKIKNERKADSTGFIKPLPWPNNVGAAMDTALCGIGQLG